MQDSAGWNPLTPCCQNCCVVCAAHWAIDKVFCLPEAFAQGLVGAGSCDNLRSSRPTGHVSWADKAKLQARRQRHEDRSAACYKFILESLAIIAWFTAITFSAH